MAFPNDERLKIGCGLVNIGNSCFFNATLQALFHAPPLANWFEDNIITCECAVCSVQSLYFSCKDNQLPRNPYELYGKLQRTNKFFSNILNYKQQDAHEFLKLFTEEMEKRRHTVLSFANKFNAEIQSTLQCPNCETSSEATTTNVGDFILDVRRKKSVQHALDSYFENQSVEEYECSNCKANASAKKKTVLLSAPDCLCILLNRYSSSRKIKGNMKIDTNLSLSKYFEGKHTFGSKYRLVTIIDHIGNKADKGHYTTIVYNQNEYYRFNDASVQNIRESEVISSDAYILFYEPIEDPQEWIPMDIDETDTNVMHDTTEAESYSHMENEVNSFHNNHMTGMNEEHRVDNSEELIAIDIIDDKDSAQIHSLTEEQFHNNFEWCTDDELGYIQDLIEAQSRLYMENEVYDEGRNQNNNDESNNHNFENRTVDKRLQFDWWNLAKKLEEEALLEEIRLAKEAGEVDSAGNVLITVKADGSWQTRSYGHGFSSIAGCAVIIGVRTNKIIYSDVKNKYCHVCKIAQSMNSPPNVHECNANYSGPSTGMETAIIVEGFIYCANKGARFNKFIADGDSSTYKALRDLRLYKNPVVYIEKFDCCNHVYKNFLKKMACLENNTKFKKNLRKLIDPRLGEKIVKGVRMAAKHWNESDVSLVDKCTRLEQDCMNAPLHCLGIHDLCAEYFCSKTTTPEAIDRVTILKNAGLYHEILSLCQHYFANKAKSLLAGYDTNIAEGFNSLVAKVIGAKRVNNALAGSYKGRVCMAVAQFNTKGHSASTFQQFKFGKMLPSCVKMEKARKRKLKLNAIREQQNPEKRRKLEKYPKKKKHYGDGHEDVDMTASQLKTAIDLHLGQLDDDRRNRDRIEEETRGQRYSGRWDEIRQNLLTSSYFGRILNVNSRKSYQKIVEDILYHNVVHSNTADLNHQRLYKMEALRIFCAKHENESIKMCGIFIDKQCSFLGASPFRLCGEDGIIVPKCPIKAWKMNISDAIDKKCISFWTKSKVTGNIDVNVKSHWYIEIQGKLHISGRKFAYLVVYLGPLETQYKIEKVNRDDDFWLEEMNDELIFFYNEAMVKEIVDSRDGKNMELRAYDTESQTFI